MAEGSPETIVSTVYGGFFPSRGLAPLGPPPDEHAIARALAPSGPGWLRMDAERAAPRGARSLVSVVLVAEGSPPALQLGAFRDGLLGALGRHPRAGELDELVLVMPPETAGRYHIAAHWESLLGGPDAVAAAAYDPDGDRPYYTMASHLNFIFDVTKHALVPRHELMTPEEFAEQFPGHPAQNLAAIEVTDPQALWLGARVGQVVRIRREVPGPHIVYRRVCRPSGRA